MNTDPTPNIEFKAGDNVILAEGPYQGTPGVFLSPMKIDAQWADIKERNDVVRQHPLVWLRHFEFSPSDPLGPQIRRALDREHDHKHGNS